MDLKYTKHVNKALEVAHTEAKFRRHEFVTPEHLLYALIQQDEFVYALEDMACNINKLEKNVKEVLNTKFEVLPEGTQYEPENSTQMAEIFIKAHMIVTFSGANEIDVPHLVQGMLELTDSWAAYILKNTLKWKNFVTCINDNLDSHNPLIGREEELEKTIRVLCRKEKNNPLHIGESGVGKTSLIYGLAERIEKGNVPEKLKGYRIYELDLGGIIAGTQYRGEFEKRLKGIMLGAEKEGKAIIYIDEIHNLIGAGRTSDGSLDASNMLKPYLEGGNIKFIGSTTYEEYNKYFAGSKGMVRRFGLIKGYETFHNVKYRKGVIEYAVSMSDKYIKDKFLPDKAIDLIDEAGAYREIHNDGKDKNIVTKELISDILARMCKIESITAKEDNTELEHLPAKMKALIYGQDQAITQVTEAVMMSKAGLNDDNKPIASLLFVGPTGVGKTEIAKVLAAELGIGLVRFDMSEYSEKHTVAKLIGSPAGYVGYEEGGLLTDAIRKTPNCVLLLDEIEKAHPDIFNILLQVMDYAVLTDNKGRKSDCRHLILIMTSNAGAQYAHQASIGFKGQATAGDSMLKQVKKTFKPEFLNRLSATVVFNDMDSNMAQLILEKKLREFSAKLEANKVTMEIGTDAKEWLLKKSITKEYGAREMDRVIGHHLKPLFVKEMLFGKLKNGGHALVGIENDIPAITLKK